MKQFCLILLLGAALAAAPRAQQLPTKSEAYKPQLLASFPDYANTPDGMTLDDKTGDIYLSSPNFNDETYPGVILKLDSKNRHTIFFTMPLHPDTKRGCPMGLDIGPDGHLYVADNQYFYNKKVGKIGISRLIRVRRDAQGNALGADVAVDGFSLSNAVLWMDDAVYVSDTFLDIPGKPCMGGIFRITKEEMDKGTVHVAARLHDPHLIASFTCVPNQRDDIASADGVTRDSKGNIYTGNFGDGVIYKISKNADGSWTTKELIKDPKLSCCDGIFCDLRTDLIYLADSERNAIQVFTTEGKWSTMWQNGDTDGADGLLDQPCEPIIRGDELIIANFDMPFPGLLNGGYDKAHTLSVIKLK